MPIFRRTDLYLAACVAVGLIAGGHAIGAQGPGGAPPGVLPGVKFGGSSNIHPVAHIPLGGFFRVMDDEIEQDPTRPYAYVSKAHDRPGFTIIDLQDLNNVHLLYQWTIENPALHQGMLGGMDGKYFKLNGRYYYMQSFQLQPGTPDADLGAVIANVTGLPDTSKIKIVARIRCARDAGRLSQHVRLQALRRACAPVHDRRLRHAPTSRISPKWSQAATRRVEDRRGPGARHAETTMLGRSGYHDFYIAYDPATHQDKFYGAGRGGYYVYDVTDIGAAQAPDLDHRVGRYRPGHTFTPTPDGRVRDHRDRVSVRAAADLRSAARARGKVQSDHPARSARGQADWHDLAHNHEVRWPFVFVSGYEDGLQVFSMYDPAQPDDSRAGTTPVQCSARERITAAGVMNDAVVDQGRVWDRCPESRRPDHDQRRKHRRVVLPDGWLQRLERPRLGHAQHLERAGLRSRARGPRAAPSGKPAAAP